MEDKKSLFTCFLNLVEACERQTKAENDLLERKFKLRTQKIYDFHERQTRSANELRQRVEYMSEHAHAVSSALRAAADGNTRAVPISNALIHDLMQVKSSMEESIKNAQLIKNNVSTAYQPFMNSILEKMETELYNWTTFLNNASQALVNSKALMENVQNLLAAQQKLCSDVVSSDLFLTIKDVEESPEEKLSTEPNTPPSGDRLPPPSANQLSSTPINNVAVE